MRILNVIVAALLVLAAAYVYKIKFEATVEAERVAKLRHEITRERDKTAALRAEAAKLENPGRIQELAKRHLELQLLDGTQIEPFERLPMRPVAPPPAEGDLIGAMLEAGVPAASAAPDAAPAAEATGSLSRPAPTGARR
ncbi:cell division protein FtsL [Rhodoplanes azumiensis]|uniref:Cell division protein FtsL n=1 Tax=Rhodoplanes azumiensis TaxID=1897628 RepID=A0ABW5AH54_9BRAD